MIVCDNPECEETGSPEYVPGEFGERKRKGQKIQGPYGWVQANVWLVGTGPAFTIMTCSVDCVEAAVVSLLDQARYEEQNG
jgi:hypothetical protein